MKLGTTIMFEELPFSDERFTSSVLLRDRGEIRPFLQFIAEIFSCFRR